MLHHLRQAWQRLQQLLLHVGELLQLLGLVGLLQVAIALAEAVDSAIDALAHAAQQPHDTAHEGCSSKPWI